MILGQKYLCNEKSNTIFSYINLIQLCLHKNCCRSCYNFLKIFVSTSIISCSWRCRRCCSEHRSGDAAEPVSSRAAGDPSRCKTPWQTSKAQILLWYCWWDECCSLQLCISTWYRTSVKRYIQVSLQGLGMTDSSVLYLRTSLSRGEGDVRCCSTSMKTGVTCSLPVRGNVSLLMSRIIPGFT